MRLRSIRLPLPVSIVFHMLMCSLSSGLLLLSVLMSMSIVNLVGRTLDVVIAFVPDDDGDDDILWWGEGESEGGMDVQIENIINL